MAFDTDRMLRARVIPCLLLRKQGLVKTVKFKNPTYVGDPINAVRIFNEKEVDELLFLDITATLENREPPTKTIAEIASECFMPLAYGGGIRTLEQIDQLLTLGVEKVVINSRAFEDPGFVRRAADKFGSQSILVSIDARKSFGRYRMFTRSGTKATGLDPVEFAQNMEHCGAGEILITSIDRDGTMQGYDLDLIHTIACAVSVPVIASGGAAGLADISEVLVKGGASAASAGSMFVFHGKYRAVLISYLSPDELETLY